MNGLEELTIWKGRPSQWLNFGTFLLCLIFGILILPLFYGLWRYLVIRTWSFEITTERVKLKRGVFSVQMDELELYRVKDIRLLQPLLLRIVGLSTIVLITSDKSTPTLIIPAIANGNYLREKFRMAVDQRRDIKGVKERDFE